MEYNWAEKSYSNKGLGRPLPRPKDPKLEITFQKGK